MHSVVLIITLLQYRFQITDLQYATTLQPKEAAHETQERKRATGHGHWLAQTRYTSIPCTRKARDHLSFLLFRSAAVHFEFSCYIPSSTNVLNVLLSYCLDRHSLTHFSPFLPYFFCFCFVPSTVCHSLFFLLQMIVRHAVSSVTKDEENQLVFSATLRS